MIPEPGRPELVGFEEDGGLGDLLKTFGLFEDYRLDLPNHLTQVLRKQHPDAILNRIELLSTPTARVGGIMDKENDKLLCVQDMESILKLRVALHVGNISCSLVVKLALRCTGLDSTPKLESDMFIESQESSG